MVRSELRQELQSIQGVVHALLDDLPERIHLICEPDSSAPPIEAAARLALLRHEDEHSELRRTNLELSFRGAPQPRRRVRFLDVHVDRHASGNYATITVRLEWQGEVFEGVAEGGGGPLGEQRLCAQATLRALERVLHGQAGFQLVGVKPVRIFDRELVATLLRSDGVSGPDLMGIAPGHDECHAATLSVLNATNRLLGNYLMTPD